MNLLEDLKMLFLNLNFVNICIFKCFFKGIVDFSRRFFVFFLNLFFMKFNNEKFQPSREKRN